MVILSNIFKTFKTSIAEITNQIKYKLKTILDAENIIQMYFGLDTS